MVTSQRCVTEVSPMSEARRPADCSTATPRFWPATEPAALSAMPVASAVNRLYTCARARYNLSLTRIEGSTVFIKRNRQSFFLTGLIPHIVSPVWPGTTVVYHQLTMNNEPRGKAKPVMELTSNLIKKKSKEVN
jgi:hypothetical protein